MRILLGLLVLSSVLAPARAELLPYVERPDPHTRWQKSSEAEDDGLRTTVLELVSQTWRGDDWSHELRIVRPPAASPPELAILIVSGAPAGWRRDLSYERALARAAGVPVVTLTDVPNQPLFFGKREDDLLAHTFVEFLETGDREAPLLLPMTKSAVRAMDAIGELSAEEWGGRVTRFVVTGASKRGWTAWLAAAADPRVAAVVPIVFDNLNFPAQMKHQLETWGAYSAELRDYTLRGLQKYMGTPRGRELVSIVDPYAHRDRLDRVRKLVVNGTNDPYWAVDAIRFYWDDLEGEKAILYVPNGGHGIAETPRVAAATAAFTRRLLEGRPMPSLTLETRRAEGELEATIRSDEQPAAVRLWVARSERADFRDARFEPLAAPVADGAHRVAVELPETGAIAVFADADYGRGDEAFALSTPIELARREPPAPTR
jgi:PhoPQ-activated pathogenicity-related protein